jgi:hypothetical protein
MCVVLPNDDGLHLCGIWLIKAKLFFFFEKYLHGIWVKVVKKVTRTFKHVFLEINQFKKAVG